MNCELNTSVLGTKEYWDKFYTEEEENFKNHGDVGEVWFGEGSINRLIKWILQNPKISKDDAIIDLGCGNGVTLLQLAKNGYSNLLGVDYSEKAIDLATSITKKENLAGISFKSCNLTELLNPNINEFILAIDKGTYDAISLHPDDAGTKREIYVKNVHSLLRESGYFVVITCCWTEEEITSQFKNCFAGMEYYYLLVLVFPEKLQELIGFDHSGEIHVNPPKMFRFNFEKDEKDKAQNTINDQSCEKFEEIFIENQIKSSTYNTIEIENIKFLVNRVEEPETTDLIPAVYEGGLKIWECTYDVLKYIINTRLEMKDKYVLDLGCGSGIIGIYALLNGANGHFQDFNKSVIVDFTVPNVLLNCDAYNKCRFFAGDWSEFNVNTKYDIIITCETIYNISNYEKLYNVFKNYLKNDGKIFVASKKYYFGVGGGTKQFCDFILGKKIFNCDLIWRYTEGVQRELLLITVKSS